MGRQKLDVARVDLVINFTLQGSEWIYKLKSCFLGNSKCKCFVNNRQYGYGREN